MEKNEVSSEFLASKIFDLVDSLLKKEQNKCKDTNYVSVAQLRWILKSARSQVLTHLRQIAQRGESYDRKKE